MAMLRKAFQMFDTTKSGYIDVLKISTILNTMGQLFDDSELQALIDENDPESKYCFMCILPLMMNPAVAWFYLNSVICSKYLVFISNYDLNGICSQNKRFFYPNHLYWWTGYQSGVKAQSYITHKSACVLYSSIKVCSLTLCTFSLIRDSCEEK